MPDHVSRGRWKRFVNQAAAAAVLFTLAQSLAHAQQIEPHEFIALPAGTNVNLLYYIHGSSGRFTTTSGHDVPGSNLQVDLGIERYVHIFSLAGMPAGVQVYQAVGAESGRFGGAGLSPAAGASNTALSAFLWPYANQQAKEYLLLAGFLYPPDGTYDKNKTLNLASALSTWRGWAADAQIGWEQAIGPRFSYDAALDGRFFVQTTGPIQPNVPISVRSHRAPDLRAQLWLNWAWDPTLITSIGYEGFFGGQTYFDQPELLGGRGHVNTGSSYEQRLRVAVTKYVLPTLHTVLEGSRAFGRVGGFKEDWRLTARVAYFF